VRRLQRRSSIVASSAALWLLALAYQIIGMLTVARPKELDASAVSPSDQCFGRPKGKNSDNTADG
jgi:hypothetical protein